MVRPEEAEAPAPGRTGPLTQLRRWLAPPVFDDGERTRVSRLLNILLLTVTVVLVVSLAIRLATIGRVGHWWVYPILVVLTSLLMVSLRRGFVYSSGVAFGGMLLLYAFGGALGSGGLHSPTLQLLTFVILIGALLGRTSLVLAATGVSLAGLVGIAAVEFSGNLPSVTNPMTSGSIFSGQVVAMLMIGGAAALIIASLQEARALAQAKERALAASLRALEKTQGELVAHRDALEDRVIERTADLEAKNRSLAAALEELERAQEQLVHAEKMASLGLLVAGIAHELRNPLNFVKNFAEVTLDLVDEHRQAGGDPELDTAVMLEEVAENIRKIHSHGLRADRIIRAMLMHARERSGVATPVMLNTFVAEQARLAYRGFRSGADHFAVEVVERYDPTIGDVRIPVEDMSAVVVNLVSNSCHSMSLRAAAGEADYRPRLELVTQRIDGAVELRVVDNGEGMSDAIRRKVFDPFFTTKPPGEGTGLGLSMTYEAVVTGIGGTISVESEPGSGATFIVRLPSIEALPT